MEIAYLFINILIFLLLTPLLDGVVRRITARLQSRQGPPITQGYYDILKLFGKQTLFSSPYWSFKFAPILAFASIISVIAFLPMGGKATILTPYGDIVTIIYLLTLGGVSVLIGAISSRNPYAMMGASREMVTMVMVEPVLAMSLIVAAMKYKVLTVPLTAMTTAASFSWTAIPMALLYLVALQAFVGRQPFDIAEAEIELLEGPFIEFSGPSLGLYKYYMMLKQFFYSLLFVILFIPLPLTGLYAIDVLFQCGIAILMVGLIAVVGATNPRLRIDQATKIYAVLVVLSLGVAGLSAAGF